MNPIDRNVHMKIVCVLMGAGNVLMPLEAKRLDIPLCDFPKVAQHGLFFPGRERNDQMIGFIFHVWP